MFILMPVSVSRCAQLVKDNTESIPIRKVARSLENKSQRQKNLPKHQHQQHLPQNQLKSHPEKNNSPGITRKRVAGDQEKEELTDTRKRAVVGDPDLKVDSSGVNNGSSSSSSSAHPEPQVEEDVPPVPEAELPAPPESKEEDVKRALRKNSRQAEG